MADEVGFMTIPAPSRHPLLDVIGATFETHTPRFSDSNAPASRRKPCGAVALQLSRVVAPAGSGDPEQASFVAVRDQLRQQRQRKDRDVLLALGDADGHAGTVVAAGDLYDRLVRFQGEKS